MYVCALVYCEQCMLGMRVSVADYAVTGPWGKNYVCNCNPWSQHLIQIMNEMNDY